MIERRRSPRVQRVLKYLLELRGGLLFHLLRTPMYLGTLARIGVALDLQRGERLLDVGCGTGICASLTESTYLGIDTALDYLRLAHAKYGDGAHAFAAMSATDLALAPASFDKALVFNVVHHFDVASIHALLASLRRVVRGRIVVVDAAPEAANRVERLLLDHDRGDHIRPTADLAAILAGASYDVDAIEIFHNALHLIPQALFRLRPRAA